MAFGNGANARRSRMPANKISNNENRAPHRSVDHRLEEIIVLIDVDDGHTQYRTVGGDQRQVNPQRLVEHGAALLITISTNWTKTAMTRIKVMVRKNSMSNTTSTFWINR